MNYPGNIKANVIFCAKNITYTQSSICLILFGLMYYMKKKKINFIDIKGGYPDLNRKLTVPHTVVLPIELYLPFA